MTKTPPKDPASGEARLSQNALTILAELNGDIGYECFYQKGHTPDDRGVETIERAWVAKARKEVMKYGGLVEQVPNQVYWRLTAKGVEVLKASKEK